MKLGLSMLCLKLHKKIKKSLKSKIFEVFYSLKQPKNLVFSKQFSSPGLFPCWNLSTNLARQLLLNIEPHVKFLYRIVNYCNNGSVEVNDESVSLLCRLPRDDV